jgi:hypothetical protein
MSIAEVERRFPPVVNYDQASMDEAAAAKWCGRRRLAHAGMPGLAGIRGAKRKPYRNKQLSNNTAKRAIRLIALGCMIFLLVSTPTAARASKSTPGPSRTAEYHPPLGADITTYGPDSQAFVKRSAYQPSLPERGGRLLLFVALCSRFLGAGLLLAGMRVLPGGDRLRLRTSHLFAHAVTVGCDDSRGLALALVVGHAFLDPGGIVGGKGWPNSRRHRNGCGGKEGDTA